MYLNALHCFVEYCIILWSQVGGILSQAVVSVRATALSRPAHCERSLRETRRARLWSQACKSDWFDDAGYQQKEIENKEIKMKLEDNQIISNQFSWIVRQQRCCVVRLSVIRYFMRASHAATYSINLKGPKALTPLFHFQNCRKISQNFPPTCNYASAKYFLHIQWELKAI